MTRKKIELDLATEYWLKAHLGDKHFLQMVRHYDAWEPKDRAPVVLGLARCEFLSEALGGISVERFVTSWQDFELQVRGDLDAKALNRLMNCEIHFGPHIYMFSRIKGDTFSESSSYYGEWTDSTYGCMSVTYSPKK